jgi:predicted chitinase
MKINELLNYDADHELDEGWKNTTAAALTSLGLLGSTPVADVKPQPQPVTTRPVLQEPAGMMARMSPIEKTLMYTAKNKGISGFELAQLLAQCAHETANFSKMEEQGSNNYLMKKYDPRYAPRTARIIGNIKPGDGIKYKGRGLVQLTGRDLYKRAGRALNLPLLDHPELAADPKHAINIAMWYWQNRVQPRVTNFNDTAAVTRAINPALKGLDDRHKKFVNYSKSLRTNAK